MSSVKCPYCSGEDYIEINDLVNPCQDSQYEHECSHCDKDFIFIVNFDVSFLPRRADCLNTGKHKYAFRLFGSGDLDIDIRNARMECSECSLQRSVTKKDFIKHLGAAVAPIIFGGD